MYKTALSKGFEFPPGVHGMHSVNVLKAALTLCFTKAVTVLQPFSFPFNATLLLLFYHYYAIILVPQESPEP